MLSYIFVILCGLFERRWIWTVVLLCCLSYLHCCWKYNYYQDGWCWHPTNRINPTTFLYILINQHPVLSGVRVTRSLVLCVCFVDRCLSFCTFLFGHWCCMFFFDIRILITPLVFSNSSWHRWDCWPPLITLSLL